MRFNLIIDGRDHEVELEIGKAVTVKADGETFHAIVEKTEKGVWVVVGGNKYKIDISDSQVLVDGQKHHIQVRNLRRGRPSWSHKTVVKGEDEEKEPGDKNVNKEGMVHPPMPGRVVSIKVKVGDSVKMGSPLLVLEAMKMQNEISSPREGKVVEIRTSEGSLVDVGDVLLIIQ
ncbi:MAG: biotin/lipoyl-containing protein [Thermoplasmata archaeon]